MIDINAVSDIGLAPVSRKPQNSLGQEQFLTLMVEQFRNQDPFSPMENGEFLGQLAQFGTVSGIQGLQESIADLSRSLFSDQALKAANLVGRSVLAAMDRGVLDPRTGLRGAVDLPASTTRLAVRITDGNDSLVRTLDLGQQAGGLVNFHWDGTDEDGNNAPAGIYFLRAEAILSGISESVPTLTDARVQSVALGTDGGAVRLNLEGLGEVELREVREIR